MQIIVKVGIDHNLSHLGKKPPKGSEKGGDIRFWTCPVKFRYANPALRGFNRVKIVDFGFLK
jgi:hypothetical protein